MTSRKRSIRRGLTWIGAALLVIGIALSTAPVAMAAPADYDSNSNRTIDRGEALAAILDYLAGAIGRDDVLNIIRLYLTGTPPDEGQSAPAPELAWLSLTHGQPAQPVGLGPTFSGTVLAYTAGVGYEVVQVTVAVTAAEGVTPAFVQRDGITPQPDADGSAAGHQVALRPGDNVIRVRATEGDASQIYAITVTRARPTVEITAASTSAREGDAVEFLVTRDAAAADALAVGVEVGETGDFVPQAEEGPRTVTIAPNAYSAVLRVPTAGDDADWDPHSLVTAALRDGDAYALGVVSSAQTQVLDDDFPLASASLAVDPSPVAEGDPVTATVTVTTAHDQAPHGGGGSIVVSTRNGTATAPLDYSELRRVHDVNALDFSAVDVGGGTRYRATYTASISTVDDAIREVGEAFTVSMSKSGADRIALDAPTEVPVLIGESADASLTALHLSGVALSPAFAPGTEVYTAIVASGVSSTTVTAIPTDAGATAAVSIGGAPDPDGTLELIEGANVITVEVTAEDGVTSSTYIVVVNRNPPPPPILDLGLIVGDISLVGYWSDGTADVEGTVTLTNWSGDPVAAPQPVEAACVLVQGAAPCRWSAVLLGDGLVTDTAAFRLRVPMGTTTVRFTHGAGGAQGDPIEREVRVQERVVGVSGEAWNCYVDRANDPTRVGVGGALNFYGCSGWDSATTVQKLGGAGPVLVWTTGDVRYIEILRESLDQLSPVLGLDLQLTDQLGLADLRAYVGIPRDQWFDYGLSGITPPLLQAAGFARSSVSSWGYVTPTSIVVWLTEREWADETPSVARHIVMHELLHALTGVNHVSGRTASIMGYQSSVPRLSPMDEALFRLNSHPLVGPGMTLGELRELVVYEDELLDGPPREPGAIEMVWRAAIQLVDSGAARFHLTGGWTGNCDNPFATAAAPAILDAGDFQNFLLGGPYTARYQQGGEVYWMAWSAAQLQWQYWVERAGTLTSMSEEAFDDALDWHAWPGKLTRSLYTLLADWDGEDVAVSRQNGAVTLTVTLDESYPSMWTWSRGVTVEMTLVLDAETHRIEGYTWRARYLPRAGYCDSYEEVAHTVEHGVGSVFHGGAAASGHRRGAQAAQSFDEVLPSVREMVRPGAP